MNSRPYGQQRLITHRAGHSALPIGFLAHPLSRKSVEDLTRELSRNEDCRGRINATRLGLDESNPSSFWAPFQEQSPSLLKTGAFMRGNKLVCQPKINNLAATPLRIGS
jgi:hypothetical protein